MSVEVILAVGAGAAALWAAVKKPKPEKENTLDAAGQQALTETIEQETALQTASIAAGMSQAQSAKEVSAVLGTAATVGVGAASMAVLGVVGLGYAAVKLQQDAQKERDAWHKWLHDSWVAYATNVAALPPAEIVVAPLGALLRPWIESYVIGYNKRPEANRGPKKDVDKQVTWFVTNWEPRAGVRSTWGGKLTDGWMILDKARREAKITVVTDRVNATTTEYMRLRDLDDAAGMARVKEELTKLYIEKQKLEGLEVKKLAAIIGWVYRPTKIRTFTKSRDLKDERNRWHKWLHDSWVAYANNVATLSSALIVVTPLSALLRPWIELYVTGYNRRPSQNRGAKKDVNKQVTWFVANWDPGVSMTWGGRLKDGWMIINKVRAEANAVL